uniref:GATA-type domain-containing protein n=1 Tax=Arundo donax TaxID=35708 RepID=A0A0A9D6L5_ARUDO
MATTATRDMAVAAAGGGGEKKREREGAVFYVLALPVALPLPVAVSRMDAAVPRKARTCRPRAKPSGWWAFRLPVPRPEEAKNPPEEARLPVPPPSAAKNTPEEARPPRPQRLRVRLRVSPTPDLGTAAPVMKKKPAKRARKCLQCGSAETPQWRSGPMGRSTLCNTCGVRLRAAGALRETEHRPPPATARTVALQPRRPERPASDFPPDSSIWEPQAPLPDVYLVRKSSKRRRPPRKEAAPAPAIYLVKKKKPWRPRNTGQRCLHCGSTSTPQWREGPMGRHTLCNACGVRYRQGRLLPEYRPAASPTFVPSEHANRHREVLQLHRQRQGKNHRPPPPEQPGRNGDSADAPEPDGDDLIDELHLRRHRKDEYPPTPLHRPLPQPVDDSLAGDLRVGGNNDSADALLGCGGGNDPTDMPSSLDSLLLEGPSAPLIVDSDEFLVS